jgi:hypothetical protein
MSLKGTNLASTGRELVDPLLDLLPFSQLG